MHDFWSLFHLDSGMYLWIDTFPYISGTLFLYSYRYFVTQRFKQILIKYQPKAGSVGCMGRNGGHKFYSLELQLGGNIKSDKGVQ